ncbi:hypothetical protein R0J89_23155, partial [Psychrobacter sp. SIMBA_152]
HLPIQEAYRMNCRERAIDLFSEYRVWVRLITVNKNDGDSIWTRTINASQNMANGAISGAVNGKLDYLVIGDDGSPL